MSRTQVINDWMPEKDYIQVLCLNNIKNSQGKYTLEYRDLVIYSYVSFRSKNNERTNRKKIEKKFSFDWGSINNSIEKLKVLNLIIINEDKSLSALEPTGEQRQWFVFCKKIDPEKHWFDNITKYRLYLTSKEEKKERKNGVETEKKNNKSMLSFKENAIYWRLISLSGRGDSQDTLKKDFQRKSGLALLCLMSDRGVANAIKRLEYLGLVEPVGKGFLIHRPAHNQLEFWKSRPPKKVPTVTTIETLVLSKDLKYRIGGAIDKYLLRQIDYLGKLMTTKYGCENDYKIIRETFQTVLDKYPKHKYDNIGIFVSYLEEVLQKAYRENKLPCSCAAYFKYLVENEIIRIGG